MNHDRRTRNNWHRLATTDETVKRACPFCELSKNEVIVEQTATMRVLHNRVKYDSFEGIPVHDHYMIVPMEHRKTFEEFTSREKADYMAILTRYEGQGFSFYGRALVNAERSQPHLHTHLFKLVGRRARFLVYLSRPYFVLRGPQNNKRA